MRILYIGDIMGRPGRRVISKVLPGLRIQHGIDFVIAQSENVSHGKGMSNKHYNELEEAGINAFSGGNHTFERADNMALVLQDTTPVVAPANVLGVSHNNYKIVNYNNVLVAVISLQGYTIPNGYTEDIENPLITIDRILPDIYAQNPNAIIVNIHGDISSEKVMMGHYLDGKVTAVIGDHWHIPTADARLLPKSTAHITDVGMCGTLNSSIGVEVEVALNRWKGNKIKNKIDEKPPYQLNAVIIQIQDETILAESIEQVRKIIE